jgi:formiminoglutamase
LYRLTPWDGSSNADLTVHPPLDAGDVRISDGLENSQTALGKAVAGVLAAEAVPIVLGGGHETAFGHFLGYARSQRSVGIINIDAHLDVRPCLPEGGHSGSPFRQAIEHAAMPLPGDRYVCLGAQPHCVSREHLNYVRKNGGVIVWRDQLCDGLMQAFCRHVELLARKGCQVYVTVDADSVESADVPAVSAPNALGLPGVDIVACARLAGRLPEVASFDLVEINPSLDRDGQSGRWASLVIWNFLMGLHQRLAK